jgi:hypothetical protein
MHGSFSLNFVHLPLFRGQFWFARKIPTRVRHAAKHLMKLRQTLYFVLKMARRVILLILAGLICFHDVVALIGFFAFFPPFLKASLTWNQTNSPNLPYSQFFQVNTAKCNEETVSLDKTWASIVSKAHPQWVLDGQYIHAQPDPDCLSTIFDGSEMFQSNFELVSLFFWFLFIVFSKSRASVFLHRWEVGQVLKMDISFISTPSGAQCESLGSFRTLDASSCDAETVLGLSVRLTDDQARVVANAHGSEISSQPFMMSSLFIQVDFVWSENFAKILLRPVFGELGDNEQEFVVSLNEGTSRSIKIVQFDPFVQWSQSTPSGSLVRIRDMVLEGREGQSLTVPAIDLSGARLLHELWLDIIVFIVTLFL